MLRAVVSLSNDGESAKAVARRKPPRYAAV